MAWIESHQSLSRHPKLLRATRLLKVDRHKLIGHLHELWWWALDNADPDGSLHGCTDDDIATAAQWRGGAERFLGALVTGGFIDRGEDEETLRFHNWDQYTGRLNDRRTAHAERQRRYRERQYPASAKLSDASRDVTRDEGSDVTETSRDAPTVPNRTLPYPTIPNHITDPPDPAPGAPSEDPVGTSQDTGGLPQREGGTPTLEAPPPLDGEGTPLEHAENTVTVGLPSLDHYNPETIEAWLQVLDEELRRPGCNPVALLAEAARRAQDAETANFGRIGRICNQAGNDYSHVLRIICEAKQVKPTGSFLDYVTRAVAKSLREGQPRGEPAGKFDEQARVYAAREQAETEAEAQDG